MVSRGKAFFVMVLLAAFLLGACNPAEPAFVTQEQPVREGTMQAEAMQDDGRVGAGIQDDGAPDKMTAEAGSGEHSSGEGMDDSEPAIKEETSETMVAEGEALLDAPGWFSQPLTDVRSGESFTVQDLKGKVILVETMAQWCSNCLRQQKEVLALHGLLGERDDFISLGLDIDPNEDAETLKEYTERNGFSWLYAVSPVEVSREISQLYGDQFLNPPSTPMLIIDRSGQAHPLPFGIKSAEDLHNVLQPFLEEGM